MIYLIGIIGITLNIVQLIILIRVVRRNTRVDRQRVCRDNNQAIEKSIERTIKHYGRPR